MTCSVCVAVSMKNMNSSNINLPKHQTIDVVDYNAHVHVIGCNVMYM